MTEQNEFNTGDITKYQIEDGSYAYSIIIPRGEDKIAMRIDYNGCIPYHHAYSTAGEILLITYE